MLEHFLSGAIVMAALVITMFFWRFHQQTGDRLFGFFALAFFLLGIERMCVEFVTGGGRSIVYFVRLAAFVLIIYAIVDKNRDDKKRD